MERGINLTCGLVSIQLLISLLFAFRRGVQENSPITTEEIFFEAKYVDEHLEQTK